MNEVVRAIRSCWTPLSCEFAGECRHPPCDDALWLSIRMRRQGRVSSNPPVKSSDGSEANP